MIILRCTNDDNVVQDILVQQEIDLRLDVSAIENASIGDVYGISSQEFTVPGNDIVNQFFGNLYNLGATPSVALQNSIDCQVLLDGAEVFTGKLYIKSVVTDSDGYNPLYNVVIVNEVVDFKFEMQNIYVNQLDFSKYNHDLTYTNVSQSWDYGLLGGDIVYPFVNYGKPEDDPTAPDYAFASYFSTGSNTFDNYDYPLRLIDFKPAIRAKSVVNAIFSASAYEYTSSFFDSAYFENLYVLPTADDQLGPNNTSPISQSAWAYISSSVQSITAGTQTAVDWDAEILDNGNNFDLATDRYTADTNGNYNYQINVAYTTVGWSGFSPANQVRIILRKNGLSVVDNQNYISIPATGSAFLQGAVSLVSGDYLEIEMAAVGKSITLRNDQNQPSYYPNGYLSYAQIEGPPSIVGGNVDMADQFPDNLKVLDFMQGLIEKFNLVVEVVPNSRNLLRIEPYQTWIDKGVSKDWTDKVDRSVRFEISHPITEQPRKLIFSDEEDSDILNKYTIDTKGKVYGSYEFVSDSDLAEGERKIGKIFAATPVTGIPNGRPFIVPHLCSLTDNQTFRPIQFKPRLLYNNGLQTVPENAWGIQTGSIDRGTIYIIDENATTQASKHWNQMSTLTAIPVNYDTGQDLHFNNDLYTPYFQATANGNTKADAFRTYWATYINGLYDYDARKLVCNVYLKPNEIQDIALNDKLFIDGAYYRINKINGANLTRRDSVEVELIKILQAQLKFPKRRIFIAPGDYISVVADYNQLSIAGSGRYINVDTGATIDDYNFLREVAPKDGFQVYPIGGGSGSVVWDYQQRIDNTNQFDQRIIGTNKVSIGASKVEALGSNNEIKQSSETSFIVGSQNTISENTSNISIIGYNNTVNESVSNAQIIGGSSNSISGSTNSTIVGGNSSLFVNNDYSLSINGENDAIRDSDFTTAINSHTNEVVVNGSGHVVIGLNLEGAGLDLLNTRANSNWLGDTYMGEAIFRNKVQLEVGDSTNISLTGSLTGQGRHENLYILNWSGLSPGTATIELPNAANNDYKDIVYQFQTNGTPAAGTGDCVEIVGFGGQLINGLSSYKIVGPYSGVTLTTSGSGWLGLGYNTGTGQAAGSYGSFYSTTDQPLLNVSSSQIVQLNGTYANSSVNISGSGAIKFDYAGTYQLSYVVQVSSLSSAQEDAYFWIRYNGVDFPNSGTKISLQPRKSAGVPSTQLMTFVLTGEALSNGDYIELWWGGTTTDISLQYDAAGVSPTRPATPSVIANIIHVA